MAYGGPGGTDLGKNDIKYDVWSYELNNENPHHFASVFWTFMVDVKVWLPYVNGIDLIYRKHVNGIDELCDHEYAAWDSCELNQILYKTE